MSNMLSHLIKTFWVKIQNMKKKRGHVGPLHKIQGYQGHQNVSKCRPHHSGDICTRENNWKPVFHIWAKMLNKCIFWVIWGALGVAFNDQNVYLAFQLSSHPYLCTCEIRKQIQNMKKYIWRVLGALTLNQGLPNFQGSQTSSQNRQMYYKGENNHEFFIYGGKNCIFGYSGGPGWYINNQTGPILLPSYPLTYIKLHIKYEAII